VLVLNILFVFANPLKSKFDFNVAKVTVRCDRELRFFKLYFSLSFFDSIVPVTTILAFDVAANKSRQVENVITNMFFILGMIMTKIIDNDWFEKKYFNHILAVLCTIKYGDSPMQLYI